MVWPPATYDVISRNHSNRNVAITRCWCFIVLEKKPQKNLGFYARGLADLYSTTNDPQKGPQMILDRKWSQLGLQMIPNEKYKWLELKLADHRVNLL